MRLLLEPNVRTYEDAAKRDGCTLDAMKKTMSRVLERGRKAKRFTNSLETWKRKRREKNRRRR